MKPVFLVDGVRTPIGSFGGSLAHVRADDLAAHVIAKLLDRHPNLDRERIADVMDDVAAKASLFERRVAHGYFVLSAAAGLFVDPAPGPVLANYGLDNLRFVKPVYPGDTIRARLTCKQKTAKDTVDGQVPQGVVAWDVEVTNQSAEPVAVYTILTLVKRASAA